jgi:uncharacterized protein YggE
MKRHTITTTILLALVAGLLIWPRGEARPATVLATRPAEEAGGSISVSGSSAIRVQPDRVVVALGVATFARTPAASREENARLTGEVLDAIRACGVAERDLATAAFSIRPRYENYERDVIAGYGSENSIAVTLRNVEMLETVLVAALEAGATHVDGIEFSVTNLRELRDEAREMAVQAALEKAAALAGAAGVRLGDVTAIREDAWDSFFGSYRSGRQWTNYQNVVQDLQGEGAITLEDGSISLGQIVVKAQVSLTAAIAPGR